MSNEKFYNKIFEYDTEALKQLVCQRYRKLNENESNVLHHHNELNCIEDEFIPDNINVFTNELSLNCYSLKGVDYLDFCNYLKNKTEINQDNDIVNILIGTIKYVREYFNMDFKKNNNDLREMLLERDYNKNRYKDSNYVSPISIFKGNGTGKCLEHALLLQNLLSFIGIDVSFFSTVQKTGDKIDGHCFNIVNVNDRNVFIDLVNVNVPENGKINYVLKGVSNEEYNCLRNGGIFEVERLDYTKENGKKTSQYILLNYYNRGTKFSGEDNKSRKI